MTEALAKKNSLGFILYAMCTTWHHPISKFCKIAGARNPSFDDKN
jgi:hypothetical protein